MSFPERRRIEDALVAEIRRQGGTARPQEVYEKLADHFQLSPDDRLRTQESGESRWENEVRFARQNLADRGIILRGRKGIWELKRDLK